MRVVSSATLPGWTSNACTLPRDRLGGIDRNHQRQGDTEAPSWGYPLVCTNPRNLNVGLWMVTAHDPEMAYARTFSWPRTHGLLNVATLPSVLFKPEPRSRTVIANGAIRGADERDRRCGEQSVATIMSGSRFDLRVGKHVGNRTEPGWRKWMICVLLGHAGARLPPSLIGASNRSPKRKRAPGSDD